MKTATMTHDDARRLFLPHGAAERQNLTTDSSVLDPDGRRLCRRGRIQATVECYESRRVIDPRQAAAAGHLRRDYEFGVLGALGEEGGCGAWSPDSFTQARLDAIGRYREAVHVLGPRLAPLVFDVVIGDLTIEAIATARHKDRKGLTEVFRTSLDIVADAYNIP
jgi:hypothetical protein